MRQWLTHHCAPPKVEELAALHRPKLGQACHQIGMLADGTRVAMVFHNTDNDQYHWMKLPELPR